MKSPSGRPHSSREGARFHSGSAGKNSGLETSSTPIDIVSNSIARCFWTLRRVNQAPAIATRGYLGFPLDRPHGLWGNRAIPPDSSA